MRLSWILVAFSAALAAGQNATEELERAIQLVASMPECARTCLLEGVANSGRTGPINITASCSNATATAGTEACAKAACTIREQLTTKNITETLCNRPVREGAHYSLASVIGLAFAIVSFLMRLASKVSFSCIPGSRFDADFWWDDLAIGIAMLLLFPISGLSNALNALGIGRDVWTVPFQNLTRILELYFIAEILYLVTLPAIKIGILCTYLRIFQQPRFRKLVYATIALNGAYAITFIFITIFQCAPVNYAWHKWDGTRPGSCNSINAQSWASAIINIILDIVVVALPMPMLWGMNLNLRKKLLVMLMFGVGSFVTIVSILRLQTLIKFADSTNLTYDYKQAGYWTSIEINTAMCCACMPGIRNLIRRFLPKLMGNTTGFGGTTGGTNLSGPTAVMSSNHKGVEVSVRQRDSEDRTFIPLENVSTKDLIEPANGPVSPISPRERASRNFSRPKSHQWGGEG
ncbi:uncharacterized protein RCC_09931 [Ramularia collo-cygni]|uniref:Uncharacterized protein n=1 Tax=Ramularia collo-cygni TaxID=112498 RepID=A0A2D3V884_9PEZI|nr:uncharacterized protein RCC_09931 [Ramularia collo-cygni]CZT24213.1 uncharacterized protein RCC_09931 [Ramularia collo-cygni]